MIGRVYLERGQPVTVLVRWNGKGPRNVLIERSDTSRVVRPFRGLRKPQIDSAATGTPERALTHGTPQEAAERHGGDA